MSVYEHALNSASHLRIQNLIEQDVLETEAAIFFVRIAGDSDFVSSKSSFLHLCTECMLIIKYRSAHHYSPSGTRVASRSDKNINSMNFASVFRFAFHPSLRDV